MEQANTRNNSKRIELPEKDIFWQHAYQYIEKYPDDDYKHASDEAMEAFRDIKFGVRIHWGIYSMLHLQQESWPLLKMPYEDRQKYQELYKSFNPQGFDAEEWMKFFKRSGFKCFAFTSKHHEGFSMFDTKTHVKSRVNYTAEGGPVVEDCDLAYSVMETPFKRDIVKELCEAGRKYDMKIDLYYSHPDWYDADFRPFLFHPLTTPDIEEQLLEGELDIIRRQYEERKFISAPKTQEETDRMMKRHREQLVELLSNYGKIDMMCLDMWLGSKVWPQLKETIKTIRKIQPDVMLRARGIGNYGDYYTPEGFVPGSKENTDMPWMVIYPLATSFSYDPEGENYKGTFWVIQNLIDTVAKGGSFMVGIGPDENGQWHPRAIQDLEEAGEWLRVNGQAIYETRPRQGDLFKEGDSVYFTCEKNGEFVYALTTKWPGTSFNIRTLKPEDGTEIYMLGYTSPLKWSFNEEDGLIVDIPEKLQQEENRPCKHAYAFRINAKGQL